MFQNLLNVPQVLNIHSILLWFVPEAEETSTLSGEDILLFALLNEVIQSVRVQSSTLYCAFV